MNALVPANVATAMTVSDVERVANAIAKGGLFGSKDPYAVLTLCLLAQAEGQHPAVVFRDYHIIQGKPAKKAEAMLRDFINAGGKVEWHQLDDTCADATFTHPAGSARIEWTLERAKKAGISTPMWSKYPRQMLRSRVISEGIRTVYPGATSGLYEEGEVASFTNGDAAHNISTGEVIETHSGPAPRTKLEGAYTSKTALKNAIHSIANAVAKAKEIKEIDAAVKAGKAAIEQAEKDWPELLTGDPHLEGDDEGLKRMVARRRQELTPHQDSAAFQLLASLVQEAKTIGDLDSILEEHDGAIAGLEGDESRRFDLLYNNRESDLARPTKTPLAVGSFGG